MDGTQAVGFEAMLPSLVYIGILLVAFYFLLIRPQKKKEKADSNMRKSLEVGDEIVTIGGILGRVSNIKDDVITIESGADKVKIRVLRNAIQTRKSKDSE